MENLDDDLDSYFGGKEAPDAIKAKRSAEKQTNLDDDLDSYFSKKDSTTAEAEASL